MSGLVQYCWIFLFMTEKIIIESGSQGGELSPFQTSKILCPGLQLHVEKLIFISNHMFRMAIWDKLSRRRRLEK